MKRAEMLRGLRESQLVNQLGEIMGEGKIAYIVANFILDNREMFIGILEDEHINPEIEEILKD